MTLAGANPAGKKVPLTLPARIIQLLVRRVTVTAEGLVIDLRTDGIAGVMRDLMTPRQLEAAE